MVTFTNVRSLGNRLVRERWLNVQRKPPRHRRGQKLEYVVQTCFPNLTEMSLPPFLRRKAATVRPNSLERLWVRIDLIIEFKMTVGLSQALLQGTPGPEPSLEERNQPSPSIFNPRVNIYIVPCTVDGVSSGPLWPTFYQIQTIIIIESAHLQSCF